MNHIIKKQIINQELAPKLDELHIYGDWNSDEAKKIQPGLDTRAIRKGMGQT